MSLSIDDLLKIKNVLTEEFASKKDLSLSEERVRSELRGIKDILVGHDNYIRKEQKFVVKHLDENTKQIKKNSRDINFVKGELNINT